METNSILPVLNSTGERLSFIICRNSQGVEVRGTLHRLTRYLGVFEVPTIPTASSSSRRS